MTSEPVTEKVYNITKKNIIETQEAINQLDADIKLANDKLENSQKLFEKEIELKNNLKRSYKIAVDNLKTFNKQFELKNEQLETDIKNI